MGKKQAIIFILVAFLVGVALGGIDRFTSIDIPSVGVIAASVCIAGGISVGSGAYDKKKDDKKK